MYESAVCIDVVVIIIQHSYNQDHNVIMSSIHYTSKLLDNIIKSLNSPYLLAKGADPVLLLTGITWYVRCVMDDGGDAQAIYYDY